MSRKPTLKPCRTLSPHGEARGFLRDLMDPRCPLCSRLLPVRPHVLSGGPGGRGLCAWGHTSPGLAGGLQAPGKSALGYSAGRAQAQLSGLKETPGWPWPPSRMPPSRQAVLPAEVTHSGGFHKTIRVTWGPAVTASEVRGLKDPSQPQLESPLGRTGPSSEQPDPAADPQGRRGASGKATAPSSRPAHPDRTLWSKAWIPNWGPA